MKNYLLIIFLIIFSDVFGQENQLTLGMQIKPIFANRFFEAGELSASQDDFTAKLKPKLGISFGMQIRRGINKTFSYETGINYIRRNYNVFCNDDSAGVSAKFDFGLVGYEIPHQILIYIRLGENFYMNTATGISMNWFASSVASADPTLKFSQQTFLSGAWIKLALIANLGFEYRTRKSGYFYFGSSLTYPFKNISNTRVKYDVGNAIDKEVSLPLKGAIFTLDFRYFFPAELVKKSKKKKDEG